MGWDRAVNRDNLRTPIELTEILEEALEDLAAEIQQRGGEAVVTVCDHADVEATEAIFRKIDQMVGKASLNDKM